MNKNSQKLLAIAAALAFSFSSTAFAGNPGGITYGPVAAQSVPVLSDAMLAILGLLFAVLAFRVLRAYPGGKPLASIVALGIAGLCAAPGSGLIQEAYAVVISYTMDSPTGGSISINHGNVDVPVQNNSGPAQQIKSITANFPYVVGTPSTSPCSIGLIVQNNGTCYVRFNSPL